MGALKKKQTRSPKKDSDSLGASCAPLRDFSALLDDQQAAWSGDSARLNADAPEFVPFALPLSADDQVQDDLDTEASSQEAFSPKRLDLEFDEAELQAKVFASVGAPPG